MKLSHLDNLPDTVGMIVRDGRELWLYSDGTNLPVIRGGDGGDPPKGDPPKEDPKKEPATFSQDELNRIAAREKDEGKRAALADVAKTLGCTVEEAVEFVKRQKTADDAQKTEAQKAKEDADKARADADAEKADAAREKHTARIERSLLKAGVPEAKLERVARMLDIEVGSEASKIDDEVKALKKDFPDLFAGGTGLNDSDPPGGPPKPKLKDDKFKAGEERAKQYAVTNFGMKES